LPIWALLQSLRAITLQYIKSFNSCSATETKRHKPISTNSKQGNQLFVDKYSNKYSERHFLTHGFAQSQMLALERAKEDNTIPSLPWMLDQQRNKSLKNTRPTKASSINS